MSNRIISLQSNLDNSVEKLSSLANENKKLEQEQETLKNSLVRELNEKTRAQSKWEELTQREQQLLNEFRELKIEKTKVQDDLGSSREAYATVKTKYDKLFADHIETNNEKNRFKDQVEQYRIKENDLNKTIARVSAKYEEALKTVEEQKRFVEESQKALKDSLMPYRPPRWIRTTNLFSTSPNPHSKPMSWKPGVTWKSGSRPSTAWLNPWAIHSVKWMKKSIRWKTNAKAPMEISARCWSK
jgi:predicted  nucleic acid-binding Zn-ribbon protein